MSYSVDDDGTVTFRCQGVDCERTKNGRGLKVLPKGWFVTGILISQASPESPFDDAPAMDADRLRQANENLSGHFCSFKCVKQTFADPRIVACVKKHGVAVVVYGDCRMVVDASKPEDGGDEEPGEKRTGSRDDEPDSGDDRPRGLGRPKSPPRHKLKDGESPI